MKTFIKSIYFRSALLFFSLLLFCGVLYTILSAYSTLLLSWESEQRLTQPLGAHLSQMLSSALQEPIDAKKVQARIAQLQTINPRIEIYILHQDGSVYSEFTDATQLKINRVQIDPVITFINDKNVEFPLFGDDPINPTAFKVFTAAPIKVGNEPAYLYTILGSRNYESTVDLLRKGYGVQMQRYSLIIAAFVTTILAFTLFLFYTKRFRQITAAVKAFSQGNLTSRSPVGQGDELGELAHNFNSMADAIQSYIEKLKQSDSLRRELVSNVSHDLRTPLTSIRGYLEILLHNGEKKTALERLQLTKTALNSTMALDRLINDLFELSRLEAKQVELRPERFAIEELINDVVQAYQPVAAMKSITLSADISEDAFTFVQGDIRLLERAMTNLVSNALQYTPANGTVKVAVARSDDDVRIQISDSGVGIPEADLPHIFNRFYRADRARSGAPNNAGLGLAITKQIIEAHEGSISVKSVLHQGTSFEMHLRAA